VTLSKSQRQAAALVAIVAAIGVVFWLRSDTPAEAPAAPSNRVTGTTGQPRTAAQMPVADVKLELLQAQREEVPEGDRNPFRFRPKAPPPAPPRPPVVERPVVTAPPLPQGPPPPPPIPLKFIGLLSAPTQAGRIAIMADGRGNTFQAREGDIIEGRYRLLRIGADSAELAYPDGRGRQVIRLSGQ
jgi:hypothetical protein